MAERAREMLRESWRNLPYFHDNFKSTEDVAHFIKKKAKNKPGHFLFRPSNRDRNMLTVSVLVPDRSVRHTHIQIEEDMITGRWKYFLVVEKKFESIEDLVDYYRQSPVKNLENVNNVYFQYPIFRGDVNGNGSDGSWSSRPARSESMSSLDSRRSNRSHSESNGLPPPLPQRPYTRTGSSDSSWGSTSSQVNPLPNIDIANRPPLPLPISPHPVDGVEYDYSRARDVTEDMSERLKDVLKSSERCECGIPRNLAELPMGWTVHLSKDPSTNGKLFYQSEDGVTSWQLPPHVEMQLTRVHIQNLQLIDQNWKRRRTIAHLGNNC